MHIPEWISAIANLVIAGGLGLTWFQIRADHQRSRRERAIEFILSWARNLDRRGTATRKFVESLTFEQSKALFLQQPFEISLSQKDLLDGVFDDMPRAEGKTANIDLKMSSDLRWLTVTYLNNLEAVIAGWRHNVADRNIIAEQFRYLVSPQDDHFILEKFRQAADGRQNYPAIAEFSEALKSGKLRRSAAV